RPRRGLRPCRPDSGPRRGERLRSFRTRQHLAGRNRRLHGRTRARRIGRMNRDATVAVATLAGIVVVVIAAIALAGAQPATLLAEIVSRVLLTRSGFAEAVTSAIPLCLIGLGISVAFRARIFNIGGDGQVIAGAIAVVALAPLLPTGFVGICLILALGAF